MKKTSIAKFLLIAPYLAWALCISFLYISWDAWHILTILGGTFALTLITYTILLPIIFFLGNYFLYQKQWYLLSILVSMLFVVVGGGLSLLLNATFTPCAMHSCDYIHAPLAKVTATIDAVSLTTSSTNPTITGTGQNTDYVVVSIGNDDLKCGALGDYDMGIKVPVVNGKWSLRYTNYNLKPCDDYGVSVSINSSDPLRPMFLAKGTLTVR